MPKPSRRGSLAVWPCVAYLPAQHAGQRAGRQPCGVRVRALRVCRSGRRTVPNPVSVCTCVCVCVCVSV